MRQFPGVELIASRCNVPYRDRDVKCDCRYAIEEKFNVCAALENGISRMLKSSKSGVDKEETHNK